MRGRHIVSLGTVAFVLPALAGCLGAPSAPAEDLSASAGQLREFELFVRDGVISPREGLSFFALGFGSTSDAPLTVPGPEIRVREGDTVRVTLHGGHHTLHWHGVSVPWAMDGVPYTTQALGDGDYVYEFVARETGTYWYHCHVDAPLHVDAGMFGAFIVEPRHPAQDPPFDREATLFLHEVDQRVGFWWETPASVQNLAEPGVPTPPPEENLRRVPSNPAELPGFVQHGAEAEIDNTGHDVAGTGIDAFGSVGPRDYYPVASTRYHPQYDTFMINGKSFPETEPVKVRSGETLRLRLVNAGQLVHTMHIHGHHGLVTHKDGYKLASPFHADTLGLFPGERYDVYIKANNPGIWDLHDHGGGWGVGAYAANEGAFPGGMNTMFVYEDFTYADLPAPVPPEGWTSGDYKAWAPRYKGDPPTFGHPHHGG